MSPGLVLIFPLAFSLKHILLIRNLLYFPKLAFVNIAGIQFYQYQLILTDDFFSGSTAIET